VIDKRTYYLSVQANSYGGSVCAYTVEVDDAGLDDYGDTIAEATPLLLGGPALSGEIQVPGDVDAFSFDAPAGGTSLVVTTGPLACAVRVEDSTGTVVATGTGPSSIPVSTSGAQTLYVLISAQDTTGTGSYSVQVTP
jgi:hypothetical protein